MSEKTTSEELTNEQASAPKKGLFIKIITLLLLAGMVAGLFIPVYFSFADGSFKVITDGSLLGGKSGTFTYFANILKDYFGSASFQYLKRGEFVTMVYNNGYLFCIMLAEIALIVAAIGTLLSKKSVNGWFRAGCVMSFMVFVFYGGYLFGKQQSAFDILLVVAALATVAMLIHTPIHGKKTSVVPLVSFILLTAALVFTAFFSFFGTEKMLFDSASSYFADTVNCALMNLFNKDSALVAPTAQPYELVTYIALALLIVNVLLTACQMGLIKTNWFTVARYLLQLGITVAALVMTYIALKPTDIVKTLLPFILFTAFIFVAFVATLITAIATRKKKETEEEVEEDLEEEMDAVAMPAEETVEKEPEKEEPTEKSVEKTEPAPAQPAAQPYPQYYQPATNVYINITPNGITTSTNGGQPVPVVVPVVADDDDGEDDAFLRTLSKADKREFKKKFLQDDAPDYLPEYKVGEDNTRFFDAVFVYLGKTKSLLSDSLLRSIYDFMQKRK